MLRGIIEKGVEAKVFRCASPERAARQIFALAMGYADDLLLQPSVEAVEAALEEVVEIAEMVLGFELNAQNPSTERQPQNRPVALAQKSAY